MAVTLYRIQDNDGRGPFKPGFSHRWVDDEPRAAFRPSVVQDFGWNFSKHILFGEHAGCAFRSLQQLRQWFSESELRKLDFFGYSVVVLEADRVILESKTQVLFGRVQPLNRGVKRLHISSILQAAHL